MPRLALPESSMEALCLSWLDRRSEGERCVLLYSGGPLRDEARYHILARNPRCVVTGTLFRDEEGEGGRFRVLSESGETLEEVSGHELISLLRRWTRRLSQTHPPGEEGGHPFRGGFLGYFGYDLAWLFEYGLPKFLPRDFPHPDLWLGWYDRPLVFDRRQGWIQGPDEDLAELSRLSPPKPPGGIRIRESPGGFHREEYEAAVDRVRGHCRRGDLFQADLSRRISLLVEGRPQDLFKALLEKSPAPFSAFLDLGKGRAVASSSPEEFLCLRGRRIRTQPIKGTRPRGPDPEEDRRLGRELLNSEKDLAELTMIVDLMRNDLGRVAHPGSVRVTRFPVLLSLPQVHHLFGTIEAVLEEGKDAFDLLAASFPPGSISGAPKPKALEILELVERSRRGVYTGAIGYLDSGGNCHLNVAIRTAEWERGRIRFGVGGGITVKSDPAFEFDETRDKAAGLAEALGLEGLS